MLRLKEAIQNSNYSIKNNFVTRFFFFVSNQDTEGLKLQMAKVKQLAKQPLTLKTLMQKIFVGL